MNRVVFIFYAANLLYSSVLINGQQQQRSRENSRCVIENERRSRGVCKPIRECGAVISDLQSNVKPTLCSVVNKKAIVCCPSESRISELMCNKYKEIHREKNRPSPLLPMEFITEDERPKEIDCQVLKNALIVGGRDAKHDEFPHMVGLGWGSDPQSLQWKCGGTLISEDFVLTAAHCVDTQAGRPSYVLLGDIRKDLLQNRKAGSSKRVVIGIKEYILHPGYKRPSSYNDIALLQLDRKVALSKSVLPACLPQPQYRLEHKNNMTTLGWGLVGTGQGSSDVLQAVNLERFELSECNEIFTDNPDKPYKYPQGILKTQLCAGNKDQNENKDTCNGDSGGPITVQNDTIKCIYHIMGITSFGAYICGIQPGVYTNVQSYMNWIEDTVWPAGS